MSLGVRAGLQSSPWVIDYSDQDLTFFMVVFRNFELAKATAGGCRPDCSKALGSGVQSRGFQAGGRR